jgi:conjugal transfer pilus assembly protein TraU
MRSADAHPLPGCRRLYVRLHTLLLLALAAGLLLAGARTASAQAISSQASCHGRFANPITDICWSCLFPLTVGAATLVPGAVPDTENPGSPLCQCANPPRVGLAVGYWEPVRMVDVTRTPFCLVGLGGLVIDPGVHVPRGAQVGHDSQTRKSFWHAHWYTNPILTWLQVLLDFPCLEEGTLDLAYLTEIDPLWADDELSAILNPEVLLFANLPAKLACAADCVAATAGSPIARLFWCAGCQGSLYPLNGHVATHIGSVQASSLIAQRMAARMHRVLATFSGAGSQGLCGLYPQPIMDRTQYRLQMLHPVPGTDQIQGQCCHPLGRSTTWWGAGKSFPGAGEDFAYQLFRKRNCCAGAF